jgi:hypothetical protein
MAKNFTDLSKDEVARIVTASFAARGRKATDVSFVVTQAYDKDTKKPTGYHELDGVRVTWEDAPPPEPNPRTA